MRNHSSKNNVKEHDKEILEAACIDKIVMEEIIPTAADGDETPEGKEV